MKKTFSIEHVMADRIQTYWEFTFKPIGSWTGKKLDGMMTGQFGYPIICSESIR